MHDIGKRAITFQALRPDLLQVLPQRQTDETSERHDALGFLLWKKTIRPLMQEMGVLPAAGQRRTAPV